MLRMLLRRGKLFPLAVDRSTARVKDEVKDDLAHTVLGTLLKRADGPQHVDVRVEGRLAHGAPDVYLGRLVRERLGFEVLEASAHPDLMSIS